MKFHKQLAFGQLLVTLAQEKLLTPERMLNLLKSGQDHLSKYEPSVLVRVISAMNGSFERGFEKLEKQDQ